MVLVLASLGRSALGPTGHWDKWETKSLGTGSKECGRDGFTQEGPTEVGMVAQPSTNVAVGIEETEV